MHLDAGSELLHYRLLEKVGQGGMGVVWRAHDRNLGRDVAIKFLPGNFAQNPERLARFEREARLLASLNHPGIVTIHAVERFEEVRFIVMELVRGKTLAEVIPPEGLGPARFFRLAVPLADAVAAAHRHGITHRDIKPGNVMVDDEDRIKVLDFGLARPDDASSVASSVVETAPPDLTRAGAMIGTAAWMAPEQAEGGQVDARADIFSLGAVLYNMATGRGPFSGASAARVISSILRDAAPSVSSVRAGLPRSLDAVIGDCLEKDRDKRLGSAAELRDRLEAAARSGTAAAGAAKGGSRGIWWAAVALALVAAGALWMLRSRDSSAPAVTGPAQSEESAARRLTQLTLGEAIEQWPAWSPDGTRLLYCAEVGGFWKIFLEVKGAAAGRQLTTGEGDDIQPAWSPDGHTIVFVRAVDAQTRLRPGDVLSGLYQGGDIWMLDVTGGEPHKVIDEGFNPDFSRDGEHLALDASWAGPRRIWITDSRGRNPKQVSTDTSEAVSHTQPSWSPDGTRIVFQSMENTKFDLRVVNVADGETYSLTDDAFVDQAPAWAPSGEHIYLTSDRGGGLNIWRLAVDARGRAAGPLVQLTTGAGQDIQPAPAPAGAGVAFTVLQQNADLWRLPVDSGTGLPTGEPASFVVTTREESRGSWSPDGESIVFNSDRDGEMNIWIRAADGTTRRLTSGPGGDYQPQMSPDGRTIVFFSARSGNLDLWVVDVETTALRQMTNDPAIDINPFWSPDGRTIAFQSDRDGRLEVWVVGENGDAPRRITSVGTSGHFLRWSDDGMRVIFATGEPGQRKVMSQRVDEAGDASMERLPDFPSGGHISFSPDRRRVIDVAGHRVLWVYTAAGPDKAKVFEFADAESRIDYPVWSPDGKWVLFDRVVPRGGDIWLLERVH